MARSKSHRVARVPAATPRARAPEAPPFAPLARPPAPEGVVFEPLTERGDEARRLFSYVGAWAPPPGLTEVAWAAWVGRETDPKMVGALLLEKKGAAGMLHGPVVVSTPGASWEPFEIAAGLLAALMPQATGSGVETLFARPQGLDRVWVRFGFIPVPEADLPPAFKGRPGSGLFAWRGGTALWSTRKASGSEEDAAPSPSPQPSPSRERESDFSPRPARPASPPPHPASPQRGEEKM